MSFYRKYRPQTIEEIDNQFVSAQILSLLTKDRKDLPHAFLFSGPRGSGKTTAARIIAKLFNCHKTTKKGPCGKCEECVSIAAGRNLDVLELDAASNRGIDEIRELMDRINLAPTAASFKVYIIDEVHMLTTEAFNALLKTLEEPPAHAVFVLATTDPQKVPATIKSRCVAIAFGRAKPEELLRALKRVVSAEKLDIDREALELIAAASDGSFREAVKFLEQASFIRGKLTVEKVHEALSLTAVGQVEQFLQAVFAYDTKTALKLVSQAGANGEDIKSFLVGCLKELEKILLARAMGTGKEDLPALAEVKRAINGLSAAYIQMKSTAIAQLPLELAIVEFCETEKSAQIAPVNSVGLSQTPVVENAVSDPNSLGLLTLEKLTDNWRDIIEAMKPFNHSVAGVLRSTRPKAVTGGIVTIEAFYKFHQEKLSEVKTREMMETVLKKLFGESVKVNIVLGKK